jgi:tripartite-type tricarboxylate transporter receptor subunit TctC
VTTLRWIESGPSCYYRRSWPTLVTAAPPAGGFDIFARLMGQWLSARLDQPSSLKTGLCRWLGTEVVARARADGYTLLLVGTPNSINTTLYEKLPFDFIRDIAPVAAISREACVVVVH